MKIAVNRMKILTLRAHKHLASISSLMGKRKQATTTDNNNKNTCFHAPAELHWEEWGIKDPEDSA